MEEASQDHLSSNPYDTLSQAGLERQIGIQFVRRLSGSLPYSHFKLYVYPNRLKKEVSQKVLLKDSMNTYIDRLWVCQRWEPK